MGWVYDKNMGRFDKGFYLAYEKNCGVYFVGISSFALKILLTEVNPVRNSSNKN